MVLAVRNAMAEDSEKLIEFLAEVNGLHYKDLAEKYVSAMFGDFF